MTLFSLPSCWRSHRVMLAGNGVSAVVRDVELGNLPEDLIDLNPNRSLLTLVDRDWVLYDCQVIIEHEAKPYFLSEEFSMMDYGLALLLWR